MTESAHPESESSVAKVAHFTLLETIFLKQAHAQHMASAQGLLSEEGSVINGRDSAKARGRQVCDQKMEIGTSVTEDLATRLLRVLK